MRIQLLVLGCLLFACAGKAYAQGRVEYYAPTNTIKIYGTVQDDTVSCRVTNTLATTWLNGVQYLTFLVSSKPTVYVHLFDGSDIFSLDELGVEDQYHPKSYVYGGPGQDFIFTANGTDVIDGGASNDVIYSRGGFDIVYGGAGSDTVDTGAGADWSSGASDEFHDDQQFNYLDQGGTPDVFYVFYTTVSNPSDE